MEFLWRSESGVSPRKIGEWLKSYPEKIRFLRTPQGDGFRIGAPAFPLEGKARVKLEWIRRFLLESCSQAEVNLLI